MAGKVIIRHAGVQNAWYYGCSEIYKWKCMCLSCRPRPSLSEILVAMYLDFKALFFKYLIDAIWHGTCAHAL